MLQRLSYIFVFFTVVILAQHFNRADEFIKEKRCRCLSNNLACWPNTSVWNNFNKSIDGRLISLRPTIQICNGKPPNSTLCTRNQWEGSQWRSDQIGAMLHENWENTSYSGSYNQGSVPPLGVNATTIEHVQTTIRFASEKNLRLIIKNTGHDYMGRSTAPGSLLLWLHHMKGKKLLQHFSTCTGEHVMTAIRLDAGVQWGEVYEWLKDYNLTAIGGIARTVGAIGGYLQGGGHGPLSRWKGMAADQVIEFDVVTADGKRQTVNACHNKDLFWALRGGGGGTFAVVLSAVLHVFPSPPTIGIYYGIFAPNETRYSQFIKSFIRFMPKLVDIGCAGYFHMTDLNINIGFFVPNGNLTQVTQLFNQLMANYTDLTFDRNGTHSFATFHDYFLQRKSSVNFFGSNALVGSRLIPETTVRNEPGQFADVLLRIRGRSQNQTTLAGHLVAGGHVSKISVNNSINPAWRKALFNVLYTQGWSEDATGAVQKHMTARLRSQIEILDTIAGGGGTQSNCYLNEADLNEEDWQRKYFGNDDIYNRLKSVKKTYDPNDLFICKNCVGSDEWSDDLNCSRKTSNANRIQLTIISILFISILHF